MIALRMPHMDLQQWFGLMCGIALSAPFYGQLVSPYLVIGFFILFGLVGLRLRCWQYAHRPAMLVQLLVVLLALQVAVLLYAPSEFLHNVLYMFFVSAVILSLTFLRLPPKQVETGFYWAMLSWALACAVLGLAKYAMLAHDVLLPALYDSLPDYATKARLWGDYNLTGVGLLCASAMMAIRLARAFSWALLIILSIILFEGFNLDSRRFLVLVWIIPFIYAFTAGRHNPGWKKDMLRIGIFGATLYLAWPFLGYGVYFLLQAAHQGTLFPELSETAESYRRSIAKNLLYADINHENQYGFASRVGRFWLGLELIQANPWTPQGYAYHTLFSCKFLECKEFDYPHLTIFSTWISLGIVGFLMLMAIYLRTFLDLIRTRAVGYLNGTFFVVPCTLLSCSISGDTLFSIPHVISILVWFSMTTIAQMPPKSATAA